MKHYLLLCLLTMSLISCGSSRSVSNTKVVKTNSEAKTSMKAEKIVTYARSFEGTRYKFGGTSKKGMDCSGLVYTSFLKEDIALPRISRDMAKRGRRVNLSSTAEGDLVFFRTSKNSNGINHVGLVVENKNGKIRFIHATTSRGVLISSLDENYWRSAFVEARKVI